MQHFAERHELDLRIDVLLVDLKEEDKGLITGEEQGGGRLGGRSPPLLQDLAIR